VEEGRREGWEMLDGEVCEIGVGMDSKMFVLISFWREVTYCGGLLREIFEKMVNLRGKMGI
jgi:hypothetical protein